MKPQRVPAARGWQWIKQGYALFIKAPLIWVVLLLICLLLMAGLSAIPVVGEPLASLLLPVMLIGLMSGARALEQNEELELAHLFCGFQKHTSQLVTLGGMALVGQYLIFGTMIAVGGSALVGIMMSDQPGANQEAIVQAISGAGISVLVGLALFSMLMMAMQFAPMLVYFNNATPFAALKLSLRAFMENIGAMMVYSTLFMLLAILATIPKFLGWVVLFPVVFTSLYASYCDIFPEPEEDKPAVAEDIFTPDDDVFKS
jgi:hypothetical protein